MDEGAIGPLHGTLCFHPRCRYSLIYSLILENGGLKFGEMRNRITGALEQLGFPPFYGFFFKDLLNGVLDRFRKILGQEVLDAIKIAIDTTIGELLFKALQVDNDSVYAQLKAGKMGVL